jgi:hypothetical protein
MKKRILLRLVPALVPGVLLAGATAVARNEQWLQYHSAREATQIIPDLGRQYLEPSSVRPEGIKLPNFQAGKPLFLEWKTPMTALGRIWMAFDKSNPKGWYDRLYFDANGNGDLSDDPVYQSYRRESERAYFGPVKAVFAGADGPITYHLGVELRTDSEPVHCVLSPACWYEGQITVGSVKTRCVLTDHNVNGTFNDKSPDYYQSDRIRIGQTTDTEGGAVGKYVEVDNKLYQIEIARDGACVSLSEAKEVPYGTARLADNITAVVASGENGSFVRRSQNGLIKLPAGEYRVDSWILARQDDSGAQWEMHATASSRSDTGFTVTADRQVNLPFGEPIYLKTQVSKSGSVYSFSQRLVGRHGEHVMLTRNGTRPAPPSVHIRSRDGTNDRNIAGEYG